MKALIALSIAFLLTSCGSLSPQTITGAVLAHQTFPSLSMAVQDCLADEPEVRALVVDDFNVLVDKWQLAGDVDPDQLLVEVAGSLKHVREAKAAWIGVKTPIVEAGIDCGPAVIAAVENVETIFTEIETAITQNERAIYYLEWANLLSSVVLGRNGEVVRMQ